MEGGWVVERRVVGVLAVCGRPGTYAEEEWISDGFQCCRLLRKLRVQGYSVRHPTTTSSTLINLLDHHFPSASDSKIPLLPIVAAVSVWIHSHYSLALLLFATAGHSSDFFLPAADTLEIDCLLISHMLWLLTAPHLYHNCPLLEYLRTFPTFFALETTCPNSSSPDSEKL
jgi:hypothetical protein